MKRKWIMITLCTIALVTFGLFLSQPISDPRPRGAVIIQLAHAAEVRMALFRYAESHDGNYPSAFFDLPLDNVSEDARRFRDPRTNQDYDWVYYPGYSQRSPEQTIILASPRSVGNHKRIAVIADGSARLLDEDDFVRQLSEQLNSK